jgi:hypothetical protein
VIELEHVTSRTVPPLDELPPGGPGNNGPAKGRARGASLYWSRGAHGAGADANAGPDGDLHVVNNAVRVGGGVCGPVTAARATVHGTWWAWRIWVAPYAYLVFAAAAEAMSLLLSEWRWMLGGAWLRWMLRLMRYARVAPGGVSDVKLLHCWIFLSRSHAHPCAPPLPTRPAQSGPSARSG